MLKEWLEDVQIAEVNFNVSMFFIEIHGLPPKLLHKKNALRIESTLGKIQLYNGKLVVAQRYLRVHVDIQVNEPLIANFKYAKDDGKEIWI